MGSEKSQECPSHNSQCSSLMEPVVQGEDKCGSHDGEQEAQ